VPEFSSLSHPLPEWRTFWRWLKYLVNNGCYALPAKIDERALTEWSWRIRW